MVVITRGRMVLGNEDLHRRLLVWDQRVSELRLPRFRLAGQIAVHAKDGPGLHLLTILTRFDQRPYHRSAPGVLCVPSLQLGKNVTKGGDDGLIDAGGGGSMHKEATAIDVCEHCRYGLVSPFTSELPRLGYGGFYDTLYGARQIRE